MNWIAFPCFPIPKITTYKAHLLMWLYLLTLQAVALWRFIRFNSNVLACCVVGEMQMGDGRCLTISPGGGEFLLHAVGEMWWICLVWVCIHSASFVTTSVKSIHHYRETNQLLRLIQNQYLPFNNKPSSTSSSLFLAGKIMHTVRRLKFRNNKFARILHALPSTLIAGFVMAGSIASYQRVIVDVLCVANWDSNKTTFKLITRTFTAAYNPWLLSCFWLNKNTLQAEAI